VAVDRVDPQWEQYLNLPKHRVKGLKPAAQLA
jgi:hypothetical protein